MENTKKGNSLKKKLIIVIAIILVILIAAYVGISYAGKPDINKCNIEETITPVTYDDLPSGILSNINSLALKKDYTYSKKLTSDLKDLQWFEYKSNSDSEVTLDVGVNSSGNTKEVHYIVSDINNTKTVTYIYTDHGYLTSIKTSLAKQNTVIKFYNKKFYSFYNMTQANGYYYCSTYDKNGDLIVAGVWSKLPSFFLFSNKSACYDSDMNPISLDEYNHKLDTFNAE